MLLELCAVNGAEAALEIEFSDKDGTTIAIQAINKEDFYVLED